MREDQPHGKQGYKKPIYSFDEKQNCQLNNHRCCLIRSKNQEDCCCKCSRKRQVSVLACIGICILILVYTILGAFLFLALEGSFTIQKEETSVAASKPNLSNVDMTGYEIRSKTVDKLWSITEDLNILYKENWTRLAAKELIEFQKILAKTMRLENGYEVNVYYNEMGAKHKWTFATSFLYALTLITTIGYGNVTPKTPIGKLAAMVYACVGIPVVMIYLSTLGDVLARSLRVVYSKTCRSRNGDHTPHCLTHRISGIAAADYLTDFRQNNRDKTRTPFQAALNLESVSRHHHRMCRDQARVPITLCVFLIILYLVLGAVIFNKTEKWSYIESCFFAFSALGTIGFGDLYPGVHGRTVSNQAEDIAIGVCCLYILVGIIVVAMCFNLIQEEVTVSMRKVVDLCRGNNKSRAIHDSEKECGEELSMSIVS